MHKTTNVQEAIDWHLDGKIVQVDVFNWTAVSLEGILRHARNPWKRNTVIYKLVDEQRKIQEPEIKKEEECKQTSVAQNSWLNWLKCMPLLQ